MSCLLHNLERKVHVRSFGTAVVGDGDAARSDSP